MPKLSNLTNLLDTATAFHALSQSPTDKGYWQGYLTGLRRRMVGGAKNSDMEHEAFQVMLSMGDAVSQALGRGTATAWKGR